MKTEIILAIALIVTTLVSLFAKWSLMLTIACAIFTGLTIADIIRKNNDY